MGGLAAERIRRIMEKMTESSVSLIQRVFRGRKARKQVTLKKAAAKVIQGSMINYIRLSYHQRHAKHANTLLTHLNDLNKASKVVNTIKTFAFNCKKIQACLKKANAALVARRAMMCLQWERYEETLIAQHAAHLAKKREGSKSPAPPAAMAADAKGKGKGGKALKGKDKKVEKKEEVKADEEGEKTALVRAVPPVGKPPSGRPQPASGVAAGAAGKEGPQRGTENPDYDVRPWMIGGKAEFIRVPRSLKQTLVVEQVRLERQDYLDLIERWHDDMANFDIDWEKENAILQAKMVVSGKQVNIEEIAAAKKKAAPNGGERPRRRALVCKVTLEKLHRDAVERILKEREAAGKK
ncbi:hypothetical protein CYMTET_56193 [Cymbomonas tetramitiformis]|uniref:Uncharacterized protein n=1 Tax=Cymbomonas tetramitiformis TaxID=36881 RepID=A0AAE0BCX1_9CHLO|nr:hypothetical protein CYMTET_56193 [Cymbomonas tetramitiformis]